MENNLGCLTPYYNCLSVIDRGIINGLISNINQYKGYLCNYQIPLVALFGNFNDKIAEIGCWHGRTTNAFNLFPNRNRYIWCVDTFLGSEEHQQETLGLSFRREFEKNTEHILTKTIIEKTSQEASKQFPNEFFDLVWIDAAHDYDNVELDIKCWTRTLKKGGLLIGHDYPEPLDPSGGFEELTQAVNKNVRDSPLFKEFGWFCGVWGAIKL